MSLYVRQVVDELTVTTDERLIELPLGVADLAYLQAKAVSHAEKGWTVTWLASDRFEAVKMRWGSGVCKRTFWIG